MMTWKKRFLAAAVVGAILTTGVMVTPKKLLAQVKYALVRDEDSPGRNAFQATFSFNGGLSGGIVTIPAGKRLVVDFVEAHGTSASSGGPIQPVVLLTNSINSGPALSYYLPMSGEISAQQFTTNQKVAIYADSLSVNMAYSGFGPSFFIFTVNVSGHLIDMP
ncbi:MAG TPA: hypothetical protein VG456_20275 [Candidatus Sulfopaludibacter sp.]|jgi:hypothetical protein|nr:hypothetical protein [Candidatus Sulfopaludibacter sp.]